MARRFFELAAIGLLATGCQSADEPAATVAAPPVESPAVTEVSAVAPAPTTAAAPPAAAKFDPPFPGRTALFAPPRGGQTSVRRDDDLGETIELKGFVNVNGPQVVLAIDGVISPIPEGGEKFGVQVISINPPQVVLQRGRNRWTASLE